MMGVYYGQFPPLPDALNVQAARHGCALLAETETEISMEKDKSTAGEAPAYVDASKSGEEINEKVEHVTHHEGLDSKAANITAYQVEPVQGETHSLKDELLEDEEIDLFRPFPIDPSHPVEDHILTIRSVLTGIVLGALVNASNLYLGRF